MSTGRKPVKKPASKTKKEAVPVTEPAAVVTEQPAPAIEQPAVATEQPAAVAPQRTKKLTPIDHAIAKYTENGWGIIRPPKGGLNDFIASRNQRVHFVQVVTKATITDAKYHGEAKNNFVQNAFSNSATPIFAHVVEGPKPKVTFEDVNTGNRAIVGGRAKKEEGK